AEDSGAFVGRERELVRLNSLLQNALQEPGKAVFLTGEPGIGKTTLLDQFLRRVRQLFPAPIIWRGRCIETYGSGAAYLPFLEALSSLLSTSARELVLAALRNHAPTWYLQVPSAFRTEGATEQVRRETLGANKERMVHELATAIAAMAETSFVLL